MQYTSIDEALRHWLALTTDLFWEGPELVEEFKRYEMVCAYGEALQYGDGVILLCGERDDAQYLAKQFLIQDHHRLSTDMVWWKEGAVPQVFNLDTQRGTITMPLRAIIHIVTGSPRLREAVDEEILESAFYNLPYDDEEMMGFIARMPRIACGMKYGEPDAAAKAYTEIARFADKGYTSDRR